MKQYLSVHYVEGDPPPAPETMQQMYKDVDALNDELKAEGAWVFAGGLEEPHLATVVREQDGQIVTTDGPFPEAKGSFSRLRTLRVLAPDGIRRRCPSKAKPTGAECGEPSGLTLPSAASSGRLRICRAQSSRPALAR